MEEHVQTKGRKEGEKRPSKEAGTEEENYNKEKMYRNVDRKNEKVGAINTMKNYEENITISGLSGVRQMGKMVKNIKL